MHAIVERVERALGLLSCTKDRRRTTDSIGPRSRGRLREVNARELRRENSAAQALRPSAAKFAYEQLRSAAAPFPAAVDSSARENHLADDEFEAVLGMGRRCVTLATFPLLSPRKTFLNTALPRDVICLGVAAARGLLVAPRDALIRALRPSMVFVCVRMRVRARRFAASSPRSRRGSAPPSKRRLTSSETADLLEVKHRQVDDGEAHSPSSIAERPLDCTPGRLEDRGTRSRSSSSEPALRCVLAGTRAIGCSLLASLSLLFDHERRVMVEGNERSQARHHRRGLFEATAHLQVTSPSFRDGRWRVPRLRVGFVVC